MSEADLFKDAMSGSSNVSISSSILIPLNNGDNNDIIIEKTKSPLRNTIAFLLFGLFNNIIFVYFLSGAADILAKTPSVPKSSILLASILPSLIIKCLTATMFKPTDKSINVLSEFFYAIIISSCSMVNILSLLLISLITAQFNDSLITQRQLLILFSGIVMSSIACGMGEGCFLALTSRYTPRSDVIVGWSSGTGVAGLIGALSYFLLTRVMGWTASKTFLLACIFPILMIISYAYILTPHKKDDNEKINSIIEGITLDNHNNNNNNHEVPISITLKETITILIPTHIFPLFMTYFSEYMINQSVYFSLWYSVDIEKGDSNSSRENYYTLYQALYSCGVFISRSFSRRLFASLYMQKETSTYGKKSLMEGAKKFSKFSWTVSGIQFFLLIIFSCITMDLKIAQYLPFLSWAVGARSNVYFVFVLIFFEGLMGGSAYVNTFCSLANIVNERDLEFTMAFTSTSDTLGITIASILSMIYQPFLCINNGLCKSLMN